MRVASTLLICAFLVASSLSVNPGVNVGISIELMNEFKNQALPKLFKSITDVSAFPPFEVTTGESFMKEYYYITITKMESFTFDAENTSLTVLPNNQVRLDVKDMDLQALIHYKTSGVFNEDGNGSVNLQNTNIQMTVEVGRNGAYPHFNINSASVDIGSISMDFESGWIMKILAGLTKAFSLIAKPIIENVIESSLTTVSNQIAAEYIKSFPTFINVPCSKLGVNYGLVSDPVLTESHMTIGVAGQVYVDSPSESQPVTPAVEMPSWNATGTENQIYLSEYTINSAAYAAAASGMAHILVTPSMIPANIPFHLNTQQLNGIIPGFTAKYGSNQPCDLSIKLVEPAPKLSITPKGISGTMNGIFEIFVTQKDGTQQSALTLNLEAEVSGSLVIAKNKIFPTFKNATFTEVTITQTELANLKPSLVKQNMNIMLMLMRGFISEQVFSAGFPLPAPTGVSYKDADGIFFDGYALFESNPDISGFALNPTAPVEDCTKPTSLPTFNLEDAEIENEAVQVDAAGFLQD